MVRRYELQRTRLDLLGVYASIVVASRHMAGEYARHVPESKVHVVGLPIESPRPLPPRRSRMDGWRLLYLGRLEASKGADIAWKPRPARPPRWRCRCTCRCLAPARCTSRWPRAPSS
jgi:hypothetical protein